VGFILVEIIAFVSLDWSSVALQNLSSGDKVLVSWFQAVSTRTSGFNAIDISQVNYAMWVLWVGMMYISVYPVTILLRRSTQTSYLEKEKSHNIVSIFQDLLLRDICWIYFALFWIAVAERHKIMDRTAVGFSLFRIIFELFSAYGTVGLSLGFPGSVLSLSAQFTPVSKLFVCLIMLLGRHRGLPYSIDHAVNLQAINERPSQATGTPQDTQIGNQA